MSCLRTKLVYLQYPISINVEKNHTTYLPQCEVQVRGVVSGWRDINHCVTAQRRIRAIHPQPYPIMRILCETWERGQITELVACPDVVCCLDRLNCLLFSVNLLSWFN